MGDHATSRKLFPYPDANTGPIGSAAPTYGSQDHEELAKALDELNEGNADFVIPGTERRGSLSFGTFTVNSGTGALSTSATPTASAGVWAPDPVIGSAVMRGAGAPKLTGVIPPKLPGSGKFMAVCLELKATTWGAAVTTSLASGPEQATQVLAEEHLPAQTAGRLRHSWCILKNTAGSYSVINEGVSAVAAGPTSAGNVSAASILKGSIAAESISGSPYEPEMPQPDSPLGSAAFCRRPVAVRFSSQDVRGYQTFAKVASAVAGVLQGPVKQTKSCFFIVPPGKRWTFEPGLLVWPAATTREESMSRSAEAEFTQAEWTKLPWANARGKIFSPEFGWVAKLASEAPVSGAYYSGLTYLNPCVRCQFYAEERSQYWALWIVATPAEATKTGYRLRIKNVSGTTFNWRIEKWNKNVEEAAVTKNVTMKLKNHFNYVGLAIARPGTGGSKVMAYYSSSGGPGTWLTKATLTDSSFTTGFPGLEGEGNGGSETSPFGTLGFRWGEVGTPEYDWQYQVL